MKTIKLVFMFLLYLVVIIAGKYHDAAQFLYYIMSTYLILIFGYCLYEYIKHPASVSESDQTDVKRLQISFFVLFTLNALALSFLFMIIYGVMLIVFSYYHSMSLR